MFKGFVLSLNPEIAPTVSIEKWYRDLYKDTTNPIQFYDDELPASLESFEAVCIAYFVDAEYYAIRITGVLRPKPPRLVYVTGVLTTECTLDHLSQRVKWLESGKIAGPLFPDNPLLEYTTRKMLGSSHPLEKVAFFKTTFDCGPTLKANGITLDAVKMEDVPELDLPMYEGRIVHLSEKDVAHYLWGIHERELRETKTMSAHFPLWEPLQLLREPKQPKQSRGKKRTVTMEPIDIEDLHSLLPPCMKHNGDFPKDLHRQYLVRTLQTAGVSLQSVEELLTKLNQKFPHKDGCMDVRKRWDFEQHYVKEYPPPTCEKVGSMCPFEGNKKLQCHQLFMTKFPKIQTDTLKGPANWMQWVVNSLNHPTVIATATTHKK